MNVFFDYILNKLRSKDIGSGSSSNIIRISAADARAAQQANLLTEGKTYIIHFETGAIASPATMISEIRTVAVNTGSNIIRFERKCKCLIPETGDYEDCEYILTNTTQTFRGYMKQQFKIVDVFGELSVETMYSTNKTATYTIERYIAGSNFKITCSDSVWITGNTYGHGSGMDDTGDKYALGATCEHFSDTELLVVSYYHTNFAAANQQTTRFLIVNVYTKIV